MSESTFSRLRLGLLLLVGLVLGLYAAATAWNIRTDYHLTRAAAGRQAQSYLSALGEHAARTFGEADRMLAGVVEAVVPRGGLRVRDERTMHDVVLHAMQGLPQIRSVLLVGPEGRVVVNSSEYPLKPFAVADRDYFIHHRDHASDAMFIGRPVKSRFNNKWLISVSRRLTRADGAFGGVVIAAIEPQYFNRFYGSIHVGPGGGIYLFRKDGVGLVGEPFAESYLTNDYSSSDLFRRHLPSSPAGTYTLKSPADGKESLRSYGAVPGLPLVALVSMSEDDYLGPWRTRALKQATGAFFLIVLVAGLTFLLLRQVKDLESASERLAGQQEELRRANAVAVGSQQRLEDGIESLENAFALWDKDDRLAICNRKFLELLAPLGEIGDVSGRRFDELLPGLASAPPGPPAAAPGAGSWLRRWAQMHRYPAGQFIEEQTDDGRWLMFSERGTRDGGVVGIYIDVTDRKRSEEVLRESEEKFRALVENATDVIARFDRDCRFLYVNPAAARYLPLRPDEFVGKTYRDVGFSEGETVQRENAIRRVFETGQGQELEVELDGIDGRTAFNWRVSPEFDRNGNVQTVVTAARDTTSAKWLEEQLRQSQKMEAVGRLAGGVAHDFNNLLTVITGYCDLLLARVGSGDPVRRSVEEIDKAGKRAAKLTQQLLAFSRRQVLQPQNLHLNDIVAEMETMLRRLIGEDIELVTSLGAGLGRVQADPSQVEQVIANLAINARDAMPRGGRLSIETANVGIEGGHAQRQQGLPPGAYVLLAIGDTGCGMDAETQSKIFEPFFTTKEKGKGTGLGLATVFGIVKQSGGNIFVDSRPGRGTTFRIYLPCAARGREEKRTYRHDGSAAHGSETLLLVEDSDEVRRLAGSILEGKGYTVIEASNGDDAVRACGTWNGPIDIMVTDVVMPGMSGKELADRMKAVRPGMKVLFMSGYTDDIISSHGVLDAGTHFIQKPFTPEGLAQRVRHVLDASASLPSLD